MASEIKVDTVSEKTSGSGVTIDGLLIKDGGISGDVSLIGTTPTFTIGDAGAEDAALVFDGNAQDFYIALDDSADDLVIGLGSAVGTTPMLSFTEGGAATFKNVGTGDDNPIVITLQTSETDMAANDVIGKIAFQAPDEGTGTDAILVSGAIQAVAEGDHSSSSNATRLEFMTGASEAATAKMSISSGGIVGMGATLPGDLGVGLHIKTADSGASVNANCDELVIEGSGNSGLTILSGASSEGLIFFGDSGSSAIGRLEYNHSTNAMAMTTGGNTAMIIDGNGHVTKPLQPAFLVTKSGAQSNVAINATTTIAFDTEVFDNNSDLLLIHLRLR
jgi:hypothetical protein